MRRTMFSLFLGSAFVLLGATHGEAVLIRSEVSANAAGIQATVDAFRADLGANNGVGPCGGPCAPGVGRREINWDAVGDAFATPNAFPGDFFNQATGSPAGRVRGAQFSTSGIFEVSSNAASGVPILFGNRHVENADDFAAFSAERIFGISGSNVLDVTFSVPGTPGQAGLVKGFGVVFTDVELENSSTLQFFDANDVLIETASAPAVDASGGDNFKSFSFVGASFDGVIVKRVRITNGGYDVNLQQIGPNNDATAMDDFIYGEPVAVPEPTTAALALAGALVAAALGSSAALRQRANRA